MIKQLIKVLKISYQFYLLKPDHVPRPDREDISISGNTPDDENVDINRDIAAAAAGQADNFRNQSNNRDKKDD